MPMCDDCHAEWSKWLDYRLPTSFKIASGASRDDTPAGIKDARRARYEEWRKTIQTQQDLIRNHCLAEHQEEAAA